jgi:hypothetical protein
VEVRVVRRWWVVPAAVLLGALIGILISLTGSTSRRAEASVLISSPRGPAAVTPQLANLRELATSSVLAGNVRSTLRLDEALADVRDRLDADVRPASQVIVIAATDEDSETARQIAQEAAVVFTNLVDARFGTRTPPLQAAVLDSAHALSAPSRHFLRNALIGAAVGLMFGAAAAAVLGGGIGGMPGRLSDPATQELRDRQKSLERRVKEVTKRERELARRAGQLAKRETLAAQREAERTRSVEPEPAALPHAVTAAAGRGPESIAGRWNLNALERRVHERREADPAQYEEWTAYLFFLREHANSDGTLPASFDGLVDDVFAPLLR